MKAKMLMVFLMVPLIASRCYGQTWNEFFKQNKTQKKYLIEQIAALKAYAGYATKGYQVIKEGSNLISDIKNGDFNLHGEHFQSLKRVNPELKRSDKVNAIISMQAEMAKGRSTTVSVVEKSDVLGHAEIRLITDTYSSLAREASMDLEELQLLIEDGRLELSDDQRMERIDKLYRAMTKKYGFQLNADQQVRALIESRISTKKDLKILRKLYGLEEG